MPGVRCEKKSRDFCLAEQPLGCNLSSWAVRWKKRAKLFGGL